MIFTLQPHAYLDKNPGSQIVLGEFFPGRILHLTLWDVDGVSHDSWPQLKSEIVQSITDNKIDLVVFDRTGEPGKLDIDQGFGPNDMAIQREIATYCRCIIVTDDYNFLYRPHQDIVFFPYNIWLPATRSIHKYYFGYRPTVYDTTLEKTKPLMCLNRNLMWHRLYLFLCIVDKNWFNKIDYSFINTLDRIKPSFLRRDLSDEELLKLQKYQHQFPIQLEYESNTKRVPVGYQDGANSVDIPVYQNNAMNLITETSLNHGTALTEKTAKAFMAYQIPILIAPPGANEFLQDMGLDMFHDYVPWQTWDGLTDHKSKINMMVDFVDHAMQRPDQILTVHDKFHSRLVKNKQHFHSTEFVLQLTDQIRNFKL